MTELTVNRLRAGVTAAALTVALVAGVAPAHATASASGPATASQVITKKKLRPGYIVSANGLRLRTGPRTSATVQGLLYHGAGLLEHGAGTQRGQWRRVKVMKTGTVGFVWRGYTVRAHFER